MAVQLLPCVSYVPFLMTFNRNKSVTDNRRKDASQQHPLPSRLSPREEHCPKPG